MQQYNPSCSPIRVTGRSTLSENADSCTLSESWARYKSNSASSAITLSSSKPSPVSLPPRSSPPSSSPSCSSPCPSSSAAESAVQSPLSEPLLSAPLTQSPLSPLSSLSPLTQSPLSPLSPLSQSSRSSLSPRSPCTLRSSLYSPTHSHVRWAADGTDAPGISPLLTITFLSREIARERLSRARSLTAALSV
ncbi:unnamed protein product [Closterium sp. NIES-54]